MSMSKIPMHLMHFDVCFHNKCFPTPCHSDAGTGGSYRERERSIYIYISIYLSKQTGVRAHT